MNVKSGLLITIVVMSLGIGGAFLMKKNGGTPFSGNDDKTNWDWSNDWNSNAPRTQPGPVQPVGPVQPQQPSQPAQPQTQITATTWADAVAQSQKNNIPICAMFTANWCKYCNQMKQETLPNAQVKEALKKYVWIMVNTDQNRELARKFNVKGIPAYLITNSKEEKIKEGSGFMTPDQFVAFLGGVAPKQPEVKPDDGPDIEPPDVPTPPEDDRRFPRIRPNRTSLVSPLED